MNQALLEETTSSHVASGTGELEVVDVDNQCKFQLMVHEIPSETGRKPTARACCHNVFPGSAAIRMPGGAFNCATGRRMPLIEAGRPPEKTDPARSPRKLGLNIRLLGVSDFNGCPGGRTVTVSGPRSLHRRRARPRSWNIAASQFWLVTRYPGTDSAL
jgi:hypothetical protein